MHRKALNDLQAWKDRASRKPLMLRGARQVGKTWLVREFAGQFDNLVEINFDKHPGKSQFFASRDINRILQFLELDSSADIVAGKTLLFFDEIQAAPEVLSVLRYFYEERPELHVVAAGSLLEFLLAEHDFPMPVGRVEYMHLGPMDLEEFLLALDQQRLVAFLQDFSVDDPLPEPLHRKLLDFLKLFLIIGGMPAAVAGYVNSGKIGEAAREHTAILQTYVDDFGKYRKRIYPQRLRKVFQRIPALIGGKLKYVQLDAEERSKDLADCLQLLEMARVIYRVRHSASNGVPLGAEAKDSDFKPLFLDIGLVSSALGLSLPDLELQDDPMLANNGALAEQFIGQHLLYRGPSYEMPQLYYWNRQQKSSSAEVDYLIAHGDRVVPVEVKAGKTGSLKSLQAFVAEKKSPLAVRFNAMPPSGASLTTSLPGKEKVPFRLISLPLYLVGQTGRLLAEAFGSEQK